MATPYALPTQWTIRLRSVANLTILTLHDSDGAHRETGFCPLTQPTEADRTVASLEKITEDHLRTSAQKLIDTFFARTAQAQANCDDFGAAVPDQQRLADHLRSAIPGCLVDLDLDHDALTMVLKLTAAGPAAGMLLSLLARWPGYARPDGPADGVLRDLDDAGGLTVVLDQARAEQFLTWYRDHLQRQYG